MNATVEVNGRARRVTAERCGTSWRLTVDDAVWIVNAARVDACTLSLLVDEVRLKPDPTNAMESAASESHVGSGLTRTSGHADTRTVSHEVTIVPSGAGQWSVSVSGVPMVTAVDGSRPRRHADGHLGGTKGSHLVTAPMPGRVVRVLVESGQAVKARQPLVVVEAMKMENELRSPGDGVVAAIPVKAGQPVEAGTLLAVIEPPPAC